MNRATFAILNFVFVLSVLFRLSCDTNPPFQSISRVEKFKKSFLMLRNIHCLLYSFWCLECQKWHFRASRFKNFLGGHAPRPPQKTGPYGSLIVTAAYYSSTIRLLQILLKTLVLINRIPWHYTLFIFLWSLAFSFSFNVCFFSISWFCSIGKSFQQISRWPNHHACLGLSLRQFPSSLDNHQNIF